MRQDSLFWIREVYEMISNRHPPQPQFNPRKAQPPRPSLAPIQLPHRRPRARQRKEQATL
eukprot:2659082-Amphidinium_carterae.1